jgi:hypothetical protein
MKKTSKFLLSILNMHYTWGFSFNLKEWEKTGSQVLRIWSTTILIPTYQLFSVFLYFWEKLLNSFKEVKLGHFIKHKASTTNIQDQK